MARVPRGGEDTTIQLFCLLQAHELIIAESREAAHAAGASGNEGTNDSLVSDVLRRNELQVWFVCEQMAGAGMTDKQAEAGGPLVQAQPESVRYQAGPASGLSKLSGRLGIRRSWHTP